MEFQLSEWGTVFSTRPRGKKLLGELQSDLQPDEDAHISFAGVKSVSYSFADEFIGGLLSSNPKGDVLIEDADSSIRRVIVGALRRRGLGTDPRDLFDRVA